MSVLPRPVVRSLVVCEEIALDSVEPHRLNLLRVVNTIRASGNPTYPALVPNFAVFAVVTNGRGEAEFWMEIRSADTDAVVYGTARQRVTFPADPLRLNGVSYRIRNLVFPAPGLYWIQLRCDGDLLADMPVVLK
jgi:hypothetical protein